MSKRLLMLDQWIEKGSTDPFHHYARAMELRSLQRTQEALDAFTSVRERFPDYVPTYLMAAQVALELNDVPLAKQWLDLGAVQATTQGNDHALGELSSLRKTLD